MGVPLVSAAYDSTAVPLLPQARGRKGQIISAIAYASAAAVFAIVVALFAAPSVEATKSKIVEVDAAIIPGASCESITKVARTTNVAGPYSELFRYNGGSPSSASAPFCYFTSPEATITYDALFPSYEACLAAYAPRCSVDTSNGGAMTGSLQGILKCELFGGAKVADLAVGVNVQDNYGTMGGVCDARSTTAAAMAAAVVSSAKFNREAVCAPYRANPPYLCTSFAVKSPLEIASQAMSLALTALGIVPAVLFALTGLCCVSKAEKEAAAASSRARAAADGAVKGSTAVMIDNPIASAPAAGK